MDFIKITEQESPYHQLEKMDSSAIMQCMNREDALVAGAVAAAIPDLARLADLCADHMLAGGRMFYIGAGTSGRLGVLDASECPPTFGVEPGLVVGIIAGGDVALSGAVEFAEDDPEQGWKDLLARQVKEADVVIGLTASGTTAYVVHALESCRRAGVRTGCITCNPGAPVTRLADVAVVASTGPEFLTGSTRLKAGTAQKMMLNMLSTAVMVRLGRVEDNRMVHMQLTNEKLIDRGTRMLLESLPLGDYQLAKDLLLRHGSVKKAIESYRR